ncbi:hypothetical protein GCM10009838_18850 [Catenulispora subtropica]|uniref:Uncharacterized protein n=1 Tax=Catenulispora subtropica TaxID=450798 RepID=A0ABN2R2J7_9ACTN
MIGLPEDDGWAEDGWVRALSAGRPHESGGGGGRGKRGGGGGRDARDTRDEGDDAAGCPEDRPWTPIPRQAKAAERGLIPPQRRLKKTSRSA